MSHNALSPLPKVIIENAISSALFEDLGRAGDLTSQIVVPKKAIAEGAIMARQDGVLAGIDLAVCAFKTCNDNIETIIHIQDGNFLGAADKVMSLKGPARDILAAERVALNYLGHLSGIATQTRLYVNEIADTKARITCTRKTTPNLRALEKYAVRCGGGFNHRFGLDDGILIKDNHIAVAGGVMRAVQSALGGAGHMVHMEIEVDTLEQLKQALKAGARTVLLDNMTPETLRQAVAIIDGQASSEASGNVSLQNVKAIAQTGVDYISVGRITHSAPCLDLGLDFAVTD